MWFIDTTRMSLHNITQGYIINMIAPYSPMTAP